ncbi:MAG: hypothetical protein Alis3KO_29190 [Aliiglaciecola sp.]|uniref:hypothetical protein n=1 Tax=Aliiglaciecola sp. M165 TaxID=2593649 RepID=UPI0011810999|nr:hypothetical protein [Aliiglaciecola sp. M165]TRY33766.1 hypothetical protein FM019_00460 [Aliiglaciecola sp. M165]
MVTVLKNWSMIYLFGLPDGSQMHQRWGRVVIGEVVLDGKQILQPGEYICSDPVLRSPGNLVHTRTGQVYSLSGEGKEFELPVTVLSQIKANVPFEEIIQDLGEQWR